MGAYPENSQVIVVMINSVVFNILRVWIYLAEALQLWCLIQSLPARCGSTIPNHASSCRSYVRGEEIIIVDRFYIALFSALEQTHCARM